jgi:hypothetical protein
MGTIPMAAGRGLHFCWTRGWSNHVNYHSKSMSAGASAAIGSALELQI